MIVETHTTGKYFSVNGLFDVYGDGELYECMTFGFIECNGMFALWQYDNYGHDSGNIGAAFRVSKRLVMDALGDTLTRENMNILIAKMRTI